MNEFPKDISVPEDVVFKNGIMERNFEQEIILDICDNLENFQSTSSYTDNVLINVKNKLYKYVNTKIGYETLLTINEDFNQEYFIKKIDKIINIDKYTYILDE